MVNHSVSTKTQEHHLINPSHEQSTSWHILGAGAMGCLWAARIWQYAVTKQNWSAQPVTLLLRDELALARWQHVGGVRVRSDDSTALTGVGASTITNCLGPVDNLLICTKAQDAMNALNSVKHLLQANSRVFLIQNGIRAQREIAEGSPTLALYCLSTSHGAYLHDDFDVVHAGLGDTYLGSLNSARPLYGERHAQILETLPSAAMNIVWDSNITGRLWTKFAVNCAINAFTVIYACRNGGLLRLPAATRELRDLCAEIEKIMITVSDCPAPLVLFDKVDLVLRATAQNFSSTLQDVRNGRRTEIAYFNGYLCELAQMANMESPQNEAVLRRFNAIAKDTID